MNKSLALKYSLSFFTLCSAVAPRSAQAMKVERPPQFVLFAYDGSYNNSVWQESREFSRIQGQNKADVKFTYFINPVYLIHEKNNRQVVNGPWATMAGSNITVRQQGKNVYLPPHKTSTATTNYTGKVSDIGVGDDQRDVEERIEHMTDAHLEGHEIASHAVGHFDGSQWSEVQWTNEFLQFDYILDNVFALNKIRPSNRNSQGLIFKEDVVGFRAPLLGYNEALFKVMKKFNFKYDTSLKDKPDYWPQKNRHGLWNFPLGSLKRPGTGKMVPSMDYNFCVQDTARLAAQDPSLRKMTVYSEKKKKNIQPNSGECFNVVKPHQKAEIKASMLATYRNYFNANYHGNRAPVHIGHHFSNWMSGAYYEAFFEFAQEVCRLPEVRCATYKELTDFMESRKSGEIAALQAGQFQKLKSKNWSAPLALLNSAADQIDVQLKQIDSNTLQIELNGKDKDKAQDLRVNINGFDFDVKTVELSKIKSLLDPEAVNQIRVSALNEDGLELQSATHLLSLDSKGNVVFNSVSIEERSNFGHLSEAHKDDF